MSGKIGITRRVMLGQFACLLAWAQTEDDPLRTLRRAHPRLILLDSDLDRLRIHVRDNALARRVYLDLEKESERLLSTPVSEYKLAGPRLRPQTRRVTDRVLTLALMYRITMRDSYLRRAVTELRAAANFRDWNPTVFPETAEMAHAFALGYDWLYNALSAGERQWIRDAITTRALDLAIPIYQRDIGWPHEHYNANIVCNAGLGLAALAVAGDDPTAASATAASATAGSATAGNDAPQKNPGAGASASASAAGANELDSKCSAILRYVFDSMPHGLSTYGVEGSWPEGMIYWELATRPACAFFSALQTALGNDYGLSSSHGIDRAGRFRIHMTGPTGKVFNFADSSEDAGLSPEMFWMAKRFNETPYAWSEYKALDRTSHPDAYDLAWFDPNAKSPQQVSPPWGPDAIFRGVDIACFRSAWDDPAALYGAIKGGDNKAPHAHLDLGTFVLDAGGMRWAFDLGPDDYDLAGYFGRQRWSYYRTRTEAHNTLLIDDKNQDLRAEARITRQEFSPDFSWVQIDLTRAYQPKLKQWTRRFALAQRQAFLIEDSVRSDQPVDVIWNMMTDADITVNAQSAVLKKNGWNLAAEIRSPRHAVFDKAPLRTTPPQAPNLNFQKLIVRLGDKVTELDLHIVLTPYRDGQPKPKVTAQFPA